MAVMGDKAKPEVSEILAFVDQQGKFAKGSVWVDQNLVPSVFWSLYADSDLSPFAAIVCQLPSSTASVERLWSGMGFAAEGRENLTHEHLLQEVYIRWNMHLDA